MTGATGTNVNDVAVVLVKRRVVSMMRLGQMIFDDGVEKGKQDGMDRMAMLISKLLKEKRLNDLQKATEDKGYCEQIMKEYHIV